MRAALCVTAAATPAWGAKLAVRGEAVLDVRVGGDGDAQEIRGTLRDDVGQPLGGQRLELSALDGARPAMLAAPRSCGHAPAPARPQPDTYAVDTDSLGVFCVRTTGLPVKGRVRVRFAGSGALDARSWDEAYDVDRRAPSLAWDPLPDALELDARAARVAVRATARAGADRAVDGLWLTLTDERGAQLGRARTDADGRAAFDVPTDALAGPGVGELLVRADDGATPLRAKVLRVAKVSLVGAAPTEPIVPHDGHTITLAAETSRGPASSGTVEARVGAELVGTAAVVDGRAHLPLAFDVPTSGTLEISFAYLPSSSGLRGSAPLTLRVPVKPPSLWRKAPLLLVAAALLLVLANGWRRLPRPARVALRGARHARLPEIVVLPDDGAPGLAGVVLDAHERRPLAGVRVSVRSRDFEGDRELAATTTDERGEFRLAVDAVPSRVITAEGPLHARVEVPMPTRGRAQLGLSLRRRAVLERLMDALRRAGPAWSGKPEPTPSAVAKLADARARGDVADWARAVEDAAYGAAAVDAAREAAVRALERDIAPEPRPRGR